MTTFEDHAFDFREHSDVERMQKNVLTPLIDARTILAATSIAVLIKLHRTNFALIHNIKNIFTGNIHQKLNTLEQKLKDTEHKLLQSQLDTTNTIRGDVTHGFGKIETQLQRQQFILKQLDKKTVAGFEKTTENIQALSDDTKELINKIRDGQELSLNEQRHAMLMLKQLIEKNNTSQNTIIMPWGLTSFGKKQFFWK